MPTWWDDPQTVGAITAWVRIALAVFGIPTAIATVALAIATYRLDTLRGIEGRALRGRLEHAEKTAEQAAKATNPRRLTNEQITALTALLRGTVPGAIRIDAIHGDAEAFALAQQLWSAFTNAGFSPGPIDAVVSVVPAEGVVLYVRSQEEKPPFAVPLQRFLVGIGIAAPAEVRPTIEPHALHITVGQQPRQQ